MRCITPQVAWHNKDPVLSIDFDPTTLVAATTTTRIPETTSKDALDNGAAAQESLSVHGGAGITQDEDEKMEIEDAPSTSTETAEDPTVATTNGRDGDKGLTSSNQLSEFYRFVTGGADSLLLVWHLRNPDTLNPELTCVAELNRHLKSVNVARFSGDGNFIASADDDAYILIWKRDGKSLEEVNKENWILEKSLRKHYEDISDLCWSKDGNLLVSASVDNTSVLWDIKKGTALHIWSEHGGLVHGVAIDPLGEFVASTCTDRILRLFSPKTGKLLSRALKYPSDWVNKNGESMDHADDKENDVTDKSGKAPMNFPVNRIFHDDTLRTFCRRPQFSPRGELLMVPGALLPPNFDSENSPGKKKVKDSNHSTAIFCRNSFTNPCAVIPSGSSFAIACRFCPVYFHRNREIIQYDADMVNSTKKSERTISCVGKLRSGKKEQPVLMNMPYRMVFAIATNESVIIGDTESAEPLAIIGNIHCTRLSDLTWSSDGRVILVSSTDGFCSFITFEENELGRPYPMENLPELVPNCFPIEPKVVPGKDNEPKKKNAKEDKQKAGKSTPVDSPKEPTQSKIPKAFTPKPKKEVAVKPWANIANAETEQKRGKEREGTPPPKPTGGNEIQPDMTTPTTEIRESLSKIKVTPRRNTLDGWVKKTPKSMEKQLLKEKQEAEADAKLITKLEATLPISSEELAKLKKAPIIVDLDSDDEVTDLENGCLNTIPALVDESVEKVDIVPLKDEDLPILAPANPGPSVAAENNSTATEKTEAESEKRIADSPVTSRPAKQPRRVQLITLTSPATKK